MIIRNMRVNHLECPLGCGMDAPVFTWVADESTGTKQKTARVRVWQGDELIFDSGEREDISGLGFMPEIALKPRTRYAWQVSVTADDGDRAESEKAWFETGKREEPWQAKWIAAPFEKDVHPVLARPFALPEKPARARIYAVGLGMYELKLNGSAVSDEVLTPFYNDYALWIQAQTYDVTDLVQAGENRLDAWLGNGWYMGRFGFIDGLDKLYGDQMKLLLELRCEMPDGSEIVIGTDESWLAGKSPVLSSSIYDGEIYDARLEAGLEDLSGFAPCVLVDAPEGKVCDRLSPPLRKCDYIENPTLLHTPAGETVLDFGQVMTGWVEFNVNLPEGEKVILQFGELLQYDNFYNENLRTAKERYEFISAGKPARVRPHFTFYGFRFVKVEGLGEPNPADFTGCIIHSDLPVTGRVETSNPKVNRLFANAFWGQIGNFVDTPTDCPQRDERMGWTGDAHVFAPTASFNMYTPAFYEKFLHDMLLEQRGLGGSVPFVVPDVLDQIDRISGRKPVNEVEGEHGSCAWADAATGIPWTMYTFFGDRHMLARQYENMKRWTEWIIRQDETRCGGRRLWTCGFHFADWLALDNPEQGSSFGGTDPYYIASAFYYSSLDLTARAAKALGYVQDQARYEKLAGEVRAAFRNEFFTPSGRVAEPTQTAMLLALTLGLAPEEHRERVKADLRAKLEKRKWHLDTGFVGTYFICRTLTELGMGDIAYTLLLNEDFPSWLYEVNMGATTVWERWNSVLPNGLVSDTGMNSMNHYAYGSVVEWMYRCMCGINPVEDAPGFARARIAPVTDPRFEYARASYDSASGLYESGWRRQDGEVVFDVTVPFGCEAAFVPELRDGEWTLDGETADPAADWTLMPGKHRIVRKG